MDKGFVVLAQNTQDVDYVKCAEALAHSIKKTMPDAKITLVSDNGSTCNVFDSVVPLPHGDQDPTGDWKLSNDWQVYEASPYEYTIKLEADMYLPKSIDHWWPVLQKREVVVSTTIRNFKQEISKVRAYRRFVYDNKLPDTYNAITYFKKSPAASDFFGVIKDVFENWKTYTPMLQCNPDEMVTTDWAYSLASHILGKEHTTMPQFKDMSMIHMKQFVNNTPSEDWTEVLVYELLEHALRINTIPQMYPFHYHVKKFADVILEQSK